MEAFCRPNWNSLTEGQQRLLHADLLTVAESLAGNQRIDAIKRLREMCGIGLKEAKDLSEKLKPCTPYAVPKPRTFRVLYERYSETITAGTFSTMADAIAEANEVGAYDNVTDVQVVEIVAKSRLVVAAI